MMKSIWIVLALFAGMAVQAHASDSLTRDFLSSAQKKTLLSLIDQTCADTWCEGDYNFSFDAVRCDSQAKICTIRFKMREDDAWQKRYKKVQQTNRFVSKISNTHEVECTIRNLSQASDLMAADNALNDNFYDAFNDCVGSLEDRLFSK